MIEDIDIDPYPHDWHLHNNNERYLHGITQHATRIDTPQPGDILLFKFGRCVSHAGILLSCRQRVIHAYARHGVIISALTGQELRDRLHSAWTVL